MLRRLCRFAKMQQYCYNSMNIFGCCSNCLHSWSEQRFPATDSGMEEHRLMNLSVVAVRLVYENWCFSVKELRSARRMKVISKQLWQTVLKRSSARLSENINP